MSWYKEFGLWFYHAGQWQIAKFKQKANGKGDCEFSTCDKIIKEKDKSTWARRALFTINKLLSEGKRWPNEMNQEHDAKYRIERWWSELQYQHRKADHPDDPDKWGTAKYRTQTYLTRDPFIAEITALAFHGQWAVLKSISIPWHLYRPRTWIWHRYLRTGARWRLWLYRLIEPKNHNKPYVNRLRELRELAITLKLTPN